MLDKNILFLASLIGAVLFIQGKKKELKERFGMLPSRTVKVERVAANSRQAMEKGDVYSVPNYQANIAPRFSNVGYGAHIKYNLPSKTNMASPSDPLTYKDMVKENYSCQKKMKQPVLPPDYAAGNYNKEIRSLTETYDDSSMLPVQDMSNVTVNELGEEMPQTIQYDRYIYANRRSRLRSQGDPIRGDLPIVNVPHNGPGSGDWFKPAVAPNIDLQQGSLAVMGGFDGEQQQKLASLINSSSGGTETTIAGVNMTHEKDLSMSAGLADVNVTAFP